MDNKISKSKFYNLLKDLSDKKLDLLFRVLNSPDLMECIKCYERSVQHETQDKALTYELTNRRIK